MRPKWIVVEVETRPNADTPTYTLEGFQTRTEAKETLARWQSYYVNRDTEHVRSHYLLKADAKMYTRVVFSFKQTEQKVEG